MRLNPSETPGLELGVLKRLGRSPPLTGRKYPWKSHGLSSEISSLTAPSPARLPMTVHYCITSSYPSALSLMQRGPMETAGTNDTEWASWVSCCTVHFRCSRGAHISCNRYRLLLPLVCFTFLNTPKPLDKLEMTTIIWKKATGNQPTPGLNMTEVSRLGIWLLMKPGIFFTEHWKPPFRGEWRRSKHSGKKIPLFFQTYWQANSEIPSYFNRWGRYYNL